MFGRTFLPVFFQFINTGFQVQPFATEDGMLAVGYADDIQFQPVLLHQFRLLDANLFQQVASDRTDPGDEEVQHLVLGKKKGIMDRVQCLAQVFQLDDEGNVCFGSPLCTGDHADTCATQCPEQLTGDTRSAFHVFAYDSDGCQVFFRYRVTHVALGAFKCELFVQDFDCQVCVCIPDGKCRIVFRTGLRDHEHTDTVLCQCFENTVVDTDNTYHAQPLNRDQAGVVDGRDPFDDSFAVILHPFFGNISSPCSRVEGVQDADRYVFVINRIDRRRINHFRAEVT